MALINCKKCNHIYDSQANACPYCGTSVRGKNPVASNDKYLLIRNISIGVFSIAMLAIMLFFNAGKNDANRQEIKNDNVVTPLKKSCLIAECPAGTKAITRVSPQDSFYTCNSNELSEYANLVLNIMVAHNQLPGPAPKISRATGEPLVDENEQSLMDKYRGKANVASFEQALAKCYKGHGNINVVVLYDPPESGSLLAAPEDNQEDKFWLPKAKLDKN